MDCPIIENRGRAGVLKSSETGPDTSALRLFSHPLPVGELRLLAPYDAPALLALVESEREHFAPWLPWAREMRTVEDAAEFIGRGTRRYAEQGTPWIGVWVDGVLAGGVLFWPVDDLGGHVELGYWLSRRAGGRGVMTNAVAALVAFCFTELDLNKVVIKCAARNTASRGVPERLGFTPEGLLRDHLVLDGVAHDLVPYGLLRREFTGR
ncbi:MAG TPA: GNAT family protein [Umezawaea sp.]|nr:GNAT family protein [Umezawaea sp.]